MSQQHIQRQAHNTVYRRVRINNLLSLKSTKSYYDHQTEQFQIVLPENHNRAVNFLSYSSLLCFKRVEDIEIKPIENLATEQPKKYHVYQKSTNNCLRYCTNAVALQVQTNIDFNYTITTTISSSTYFIILIIEMQSF